MFFYFMSLLHINMAQAIEIFPHVRQGSAYYTIRTVAAADHT